MHKNHAHENDDTYKEQTYLWEHAMQLHDINESVQLLRHALLQTKLSVYALKNIILSSPGTWEQYFLTMKFQRMSWQTWFNFLKNIWHMYQWESEELWPSCIWVSLVEDSPCAAEWRGALWNTFQYDPEMWAKVCWSMGKPQALEADVKEPAQQVYNEKVCTRSSQWVRCFNVSMFHEFGCDTTGLWADFAKNVHRNNVFCLLGFSMWLCIWPTHSLHLYGESLSNKQKYAAK